MSSLERKLLELKCMVEIGRIPPWEYEELKHRAIKEHHEIEMMRHNQMMYQSVQGQQSIGLGSLGNALSSGNPVPQSSEQQKVKASENKLLLLIGEN